MKQFDYETFIAPYKNMLDSSQHRSKCNFFDFVIPRLVEKGKPLYIVETGCMHTDLSQNAGAITMIFADLIKNWTGGKLKTIDISPVAIEKCQHVTREYADCIEYVISDSVEHLKNMPAWETREIDFLFLDSYDLDVFDPLPSAIHHFRELLAVYDNLSRETIVSVDDNFLPGTIVYWNYNDGTQTTFDTKDGMVGKGTLTDRFLRDQGWTRAFTEVIGEGNILTYTR